MYEALIVDHNSLPNGLKFYLYHGLLIWLLS